MSADNPKTSEQAIQMNVEVVFLASNGEGKASNIHKRVTTVMQADFGMTLEELAKKVVEAKPTP